MPLELMIFGIVVLVLSVIIHEVAHGYAAHALGDPTAKLAGRLTVNPVPHIDLFGSILLPGLMVLSGAGVLFGWAKPVPYNPYNLKNQRWGEAIVGIAGVATNLLIALVFALVTRYALGAGLDVFAQLAAIIVITNLSLGLFNLIPIPPLDGFTVLRGILPYAAAMRLRDLEDRIARGGAFSLIAILFIFVYFLSGPFSLLIRSTAGFLIGG